MQARRHLFWPVTASVLCMALSVCFAWAQTKGDVSGQLQAWPHRPLRFVVGFPAGGTGDVVARLIGDRLGPLLGSSIVVENKAGAAGVSAANFVRNAGDDHTFLVASETYVLTPLVNRSANFNLLQDFQPIGIAAEGPQVVLATATAPFRTFHELTKHVRTSRTGVDYTTSGFGHPQHLIGEYLRNKLNGNLVHVPARGGGAAVNDLLSGTVNVGILGLGPTYQLIQDGRLLPLAVSTAKRITALPNVPTLSELGFEGFSAPQWIGIVAPSSLGSEPRRRVSLQMARALADPVLRQRFAALGFEPIFLDSTAMGARIAEEESRWLAIVRAANLTAQ